MEESDSDDMFEVINLDKVPSPFRQKQEDEDFSFRFPPAPPLPIPPLGLDCSFGSTRQDAGYENRDPFRIKEEEETVESCAPVADLLLSSHPLPPEKKEVEIISLIDEDDEEEEEMAAINVDEEEEEEKEDKDDEEDEEEMKDDEEDQEEMEDGEEQEEQPQQEDVEEEAITDPLALLISTQPPVFWTNETFRLFLRKVDAKIVSDPEDWNALDLARKLQRCLTSLFIIERTYHEVNDDDPFDLRFQQQKEEFYLNFTKICNILHLE